MSQAIKRSQGSGLLRRALPAVGRGIRQVGRQVVRQGVRRIVRRPRRRRRARGISGSELRGFRKVARLLANFGMRPRGLAGPMRRGGRRPF